MRVRCAFVMLCASTMAEAQDTTQRFVPITLAVASADSGVATDRRRAGSVDLPLAERSYLFTNVPNGKTNELFEGNLALHFPMFDRVRLHYDSTFQHPNDRRGAWAISFSMLVNLRMTHEESAPVRTPSYMPRVRVQRLSSVYRPKISGPFPSGGVIQQRVYDAIVGHYSNGQDGCLFVGQIEAGDDCAFPVVRPADKDLVVNRRDGSFSSHYVEGAFTWRRISLDDATFEDDRTYARTVLAVGARYRNYVLLSGVGGGMTRELRDLYGPHRARLTASWSRETNDTRRLPGRLWVEGFVEALPGVAPQIEPVRVSLEVGRSLDGMQGTGFFARYYRGQDDYNLGFLTQLHVIQAGIVLGGEARPSFRR